MITVHDLPSTINNGSETLLLLSETKGRGGTRNESGGVGRSR